MQKRLIAVLFVIGLVAGSVYLGNVIVRSPEFGVTILVGIAPALACIWILTREHEDRRFLIRLFLVALALRWVVAFFIHDRGLQSFFGGDATTFDIVGNAISQAWQGKGSLDTAYMQSYLGDGRPGWGMFYFVGAIYYLIGQNPLAVQLLNCALGAAACIAVYRIAIMIFPQQRVARTAAIFIAFSPSMILWSSQVLKDAAIVLSLCLCTLFTLKLREKFKVKDLFLLLVSLVCLYSLRNYASYIMFLAIAGSLMLTAKRFSPVRVLQGGLLVTVLGMAMAYFGAANVPTNTFDLKRIQSTREWAAKEAKSGYGGEVDISDPGAALGFLPVGLLYVLFAPFPWDISGVRQMITLPELLVWWALVPMLVKGYWFAIRNRLKETFSICVFTIGLTMVYALYQSNVGTAYRHRAQLYVFFMIFVSAGLQLRREARERKRTQFALGYPVAPARTVPLAQPQLSTIAIQEHRRL